VSGTFFPSEGLKSMTFSKIKHLAKSNIFCSIFILTTIPTFYYVCRFTHNCMGGHLKHFPYPFWHLFTELHWVCSFFFVAHTDFKSANLFRKIYAVILIYLCFKNFFGSFDHYLYYTYISVVLIACLRFLFSSSVFIYRRLHSHR